MLSIVNEGSIAQASMMSSAESAAHFSVQPDAPLHMQRVAVSGWRPWHAKLVHSVSQGLLDWQNDPRPLDNLQGCGIIIAM